MPGAGAMHHADRAEDRPLIIEAPGYRGPERRRTENEWRRHVESRLTAGAEVMDRTEKKVDENTAITQALANDTREMVQAFNNAKGAFKFFEGVAKIMRPIGAIAVTLAAIWGFFSLVKGGTPPKP